MRVYVDTSALLKRVFAENESQALTAVLTEYVRTDAALVTSSLAWVEVSRAVRAQASTGTEVPVDAEELVEVALSGVLEKPITAEVIALARRINPPVLRSLDAIHLASALLVDADVVVTYDLRLIEATPDQEIPALSPAGRG